MMWRNKEREPEAEDVGVGSRSGSIPAINTGSDYCLCCYHLFTQFVNVVYNFLLAFLRRFLEAIDIIPK